MFRQNITLAIFDVRPINPETKRVNFELIENLKPEINLKASYLNILPVKIIPPIFNSRKEVLEELEATLSEKIDLNKELNLFGGRLVNFKLRPQKYLSSEDGNLEKFRDEFSKIFSGAAAESSAARARLLAPPSRLPWAPEVKEREPEKILIYFALSVASVFVLTFLSVESLNLKNSILQRSNQAYINLNSVQNNLSEFNFSGAASSFALAARNFELMHQDLKKAGSIFSVLDKVTLGGTSNVSSFLKAGELIFGAGVELATALEKISDVNLISVIQSNVKNKTGAGILEILRQFRLDLIQASRSLNEASVLIADIDTGLIPESERKKFEELKLKLPEFKSFMEKAIRYSDALMIMLGQSSRQKYILLFQNTSELRPTGGFPGSYALLEFNKGTMEKFFVDDIYNPDGQMKEKIIPPWPLQKITPNWGMRDANWFSDFPASAKKVAEFYYKDTGILVDGVMAVNVDLIPEILKVTGPLEMADFGITLDSENFISEVQKEVEYEKTKGEGQPKQVLVEFGPKLLERLSILSREDWMKVFAVLVAGVEKKDILGYFTEARLQNLALENGFAGEIKETQNSDYLMITHSNIMGSKTDAVIDNFISLNIETDSSGGLIHTLEITRSHKGGDLGFYNRKNNDYIRVLVPQDAELIEVSGNDNFEIKPLLDYGKNGFTSDPDLERYELSLSEGGKKTIAFWLITEPKKTKTVTVKYKTPDYNAIYLQKSPGVKSGFKVIFNEKTLFDEKFSSDKNITLE